MSDEKRILPGQFTKDIEQARKISDKEYQRRLKRRNRTADLYPVNTISKLAWVIKTAKRNGHKINPTVVKNIVKKLHSLRKIDVSVYRAVFQMSDKEITKKIIDG